MAVVTLNKSEVKKIIGKTKDEDLNNELSLFGLGVEKVDDNEIDVEVTPNRPDLLSQHGIFRALNSYFKNKNKTYQVSKPQKDYSVKIDSAVKSVRPFTACAIVKGLKFDDEKIKEIIDIQEKLHTTVGRNRKKLAIGIYPLEKIKLPIIYKAELPENIKFIPLEMNRELNARQILSKHPTGREYRHLLQEAKLYPVFRDAENQVLSMPPIINSDKTGKITEDTKDVFIECSGFDFEVLKKTLNIIVTTLADMGGEIFSMNLDYGKKKITSPNLEPEKIKIEIKDAEKLLGIELNEAKVKKLLEKMNYNYNSKNKEVEIPAYRVDILHPADIYEDIAIAYGYENFLPEIPEISTIGQSDKKEIKKVKIAEVLTGLGFLETSSYHLTTKQDLRNCGFRIPVLEVKDSKTEYNVLRSSLLTQQLKLLGENIDAQYPQKIFEIGTVFEKIEKTEEIKNKEKEGIINEKEHLCIAIAGETNFTEIKQVLEYLMKMLNLNCKIKEAEHPSFIDGRTAEIIIDGKSIGFMGEIAPFVLKNQSLKMPAVALEIETEKL